MKKLMIVFSLLMLSIAIFAQEIEPPTSIVDVISNFGFWIGSYLPLVVLTVFLVALVIKLFKVTGSGLKQIISWGLGPVLVIVLNLLQLGIASDLSVYGVFAYAVAVSLGANRAFDVGLLASILASLDLGKKEKTK